MSTWYHIYPSADSVSQIRKGNYILEFKDTLLAIPDIDIDLHEHNKPFYVGNSLNKAFVEKIYLVADNQGANLILTNIEGGEEKTVSKIELENGRFYSTVSNDLSVLLPFNWN